MKLNFWQWIGVLLIIIALGAITWRNTAQTANPPTATQPSGEIR